MPAAAIEIWIICLSKTNRNNWGSGYYVCPSNHFSFITRTGCISKRWWQCLQSYIFPVLTHGNNFPRVDISLLTFSWFLSKRCSLVENQEKPYFIVYGLTWLGLEPTFYCTRCEHAIHNIISAGIKQCKSSSKVKQAVQKSINCRS